ncbi:hypothetical protein [Staphylococcus shinii]|uniref:hypothetical protein n=1 Tax=Staphylococcus shinii TaxID=2912228 RepID=UPI003F87FC68
MINIISAIGSLGTFIMALFYFVSVSVQLYQMKISFIPALGFNQILLIRDKDQKLILKNTTSNVEENEDYLKLYNLGGGAAKKITIEVLLGEDKVIQKKYVNMLPINKTVFDELEDTIKNNGYESNMNIKLSYYHNVSRKKQEIFLKGHIDAFNNYEDKNIYELQFI